MQIGAHWDKHCDRLLKGHATPFRDPRVEERSQRHLR
jgi:hypothetical protein